MTNNEIIARWAGWKRNRFDYRTPDYENSDAAAITLLPVLVEKKLNVELTSGTGGWWARLWDRDLCIVNTVLHPTISAAITSAVLALIESGGAR